MFNKTKLVVLAGLWLLFNGCSNKTNDYQLLQTDANLTQQKVVVSDRSIEYRILPQDRLEIALYKDPQQDATVTGSLGQSMSPNGILVNTAGHVPLPLLSKNGTRWKEDENLGPIF